ncbi:MAG TPA: hypothetical protein VIM96_11435 [Pseudomonadales bacterium]
MKTNTLWNGIPRNARKALILSSSLLAITLSSPAYTGGISERDLYAVHWEPAKLQAPARIASSTHLSAGHSATAKAEPRRESIAAASVKNYEAVLGDSNERFNRLWLKSFSPDANRYEGETAGRKLFQMWARSAWKQFGAKQYKTADYVVNRLDTSSEYKPDYGNQKSDFDYRLSLSEDDVELKLNYSFY